MAEFVAVLNDVSAGMNDVSAGINQLLRKELPTWNISQMSNDKTQCLVSSMGLECINECEDDLRAYASQLPPVQALGGTPVSFNWPNDDEERDTPAASMFIASILQQCGVQIGADGFRVVDVHSDTLFNMNVGTTAVLTGKTDVIVVPFV
jgi:hypothetical protein